MQVYSNFWKTFLKLFQVTTSTLSCEVKSSRLTLIKSNQVESTCGHFSLKLGHISSLSWLSRWHKNRLNVLYQLKNIRPPAHSPRYCWTSCWSDAHDKEHNCTYQSEETQSNTNVPDLDRFVTRTRSQEWTSILSLSTLKPTYRVHLLYNFTFVKKFTQRQQSLVVDLYAGQNLITALSWRQLTAEWIEVYKSTVGWCPMWWPPCRIQIAPIQSPTTEKRWRKKDTYKPQGKHIMACPIVRP